MTDRELASRRRFLAAAGTAGLVGSAGCSDLLGNGPAEGTPTVDPEPALIGSARAGRGLPGGTAMAEMPELSGELMVYSGRGRFLVGQLLDSVRERNPDLRLRVRYGGAADLANQIRTEGQSTPADVFFTVNAGILGLLAGEDRLVPLPAGVLGLGRAGYQHPDGVWIGTSGRVRSIPFNTGALAASALPSDILDFPDQTQLEGEVGWAVTYGSFQGFVTVMRILNGERRTREWLRGMVELNVQEFSSEFRVAQAIADGEISAGFTNHYYPIRVLDARPDAPLDIAFTENDAGSFFNVAGAGVVDASGRRELAANFVRHLLSAEAQDYFARSATFEYPMIPEVAPIERLPSFDQLSPPDLDLAEFARADINETIDLMQDVGVL